MSARPGPPNVHPAGCHGTIDIAGCTSDEFVRLSRDRGPARPQALEIYRAALRERKALVDWITLPSHPIVNTLREGVTTKFILRHEDGLETESVILPIAGSTGRVRQTLCVSSQIGCAMGCRFCETAQMGLMRNLTASQIVAQWLAARFDLTTAIDNIVFMGMGEPMENLDAVLHAIEILCDRNGAGIAPAGVCVSTVGRAEGVIRLAEFARRPGFGKLRLAVSVNAPNDAIRGSIMPINRATPMTELMQAMLRWPTDAESPSAAGGGGRRRVFIEYVLIPGVNDALEHADELCAYLKPLRCTVNVIPYNPRRDSPWIAPSEESVSAFVARVHANGQFVKRRQTMGRSVMAACGQLGNAEIRRRKIVDVRVAGE